MPVPLARQRTKQQSLAYSFCRYRTTLNACIQSFLRKQGMHQSMQRGSIARAPSALPMSSGSHPNCSMILLARRDAIGRP